MQGFKNMYNTNWSFNEYFNSLSTDFKKLYISVEQVKVLFYICMELEELNKSNALYFELAESRTTISNPFLSECCQEFVNPIEYYGLDFLNSKMFKNINNFKIAKRATESEIQKYAKVYIKTHLS